MKYKLIKEYPGSPKLGTITDRTMYFPEYYPSFWQPVVEKDYEILSLVASEKNPQHKKGSKFLHNKDYKFKNMHPTEFWDIYSVKRISDNKTFTIGDVYGDLIIEKMVMSVDNNILTTYKPKIKEPIFQTEDGVDIFEGDNLYSIDNMLNIKKHLLFNARYDDNTLLNNRIFFNSDYKHFSTKEKAEEYILLNKPCLSYNEVLNATKIRNKNTFETLKDLVKSKIQQSV